MTTYADPLAFIDGEIARAAAPRTSNKKPIFLYFKEGHKALIRPLADLSGCVIMSKHDKYNADPNLKVSAICAAEIGEDCKYCADVPNDKKLGANVRFYLPVYVYQVVDQRTQSKVTYKEKDEAGNETEKAVSGVRMIELSSFGTIGDVLKWFREFMREEDNCHMTECDFSISQVGQGQSKSFNVMPKQPKAIDPRITAMIPTKERIRERILENLAPVTVGNAIATPVVTKAAEEITPDVDTEF